MKKVLKYLRELSVVVVGIAITVSIGIWINNRNNEKDLELYLDAIKLELEQNIKDIDLIIESMQQSVAYANYLATHDKDSLNRDTINSYSNVFYQIQSISYKTNAFEMFKLSGVMRLMDDRELLLSIWEGYTFLDELKTLLEWGFQLKFEEVKKELPMLAAGKTDFIPMYTFYTVTPWPYEMPRLCSDASDTLKEILSKLRGEQSSPGK